MKKIVLYYDIVSPFSYLAYETLIKLRSLSLSHFFSFSYFLVVPELF